MKRILVIAGIIGAFALGAVSQRGSQGLNVNSRWLMRGARCTYERLSPKDYFPKEGKFQELATVEVSKTVDENAWVISFKDYYGCGLSFWAESGGMNHSIPVKALSSY